MIRIFTLLLIPGILALAIACGDDDGGDQPAPTSTVDAPAATATVTVPADRTGIAEVDAVLDAVDSGDREALAALVGFTVIPCVEEVVGKGAPPECRADEPDGTPVDVFTFVECEGAYLRPDEMAGLLDPLLGPDVDLYAVYAGLGELFPPGEYAAIYSGVVGPAGAGVLEFAYRVVIENGTIIGAGTGCAQTPEELVAFAGLTDPVLPPRSP